MENTAFEFENSKYGSLVTYKFLEDLGVWEGKAILTQQYKHPDAENWDDELKVELTVTEETFNKATIELNSMVIELMSACNGNFRLLETKTPEFSGDKVQ